MVIQFIGKDNLSGVARKVGNAIGGVDDKSGKAKSSFGKLSASWSAAVPIAGAVIGAGIGMANALIDASKAALEDKQQADKLAKVLGTIPGVTQKAIDANEDWISSMQLATLVSDTELRQAVQKLALATGDLGAAQKLTALAVDTAAGSGKNLSTVTDALAKATGGNTAALKRQFPWLDANKDGTLTLQEATDGLTRAFKGSAKEASKTKPWERINVIWGEISEALGGVLLPLIEEFGDWFAKKENQKAIQKFIDRVSELAGQLGDDLVQAFKDAMKWLKDPKNQQKIEDYAETFAGVAKAVADLARDLDWLLSAINKLPSNIILNFITKGLGNRGGGGSRPIYGVPKGARAAGGAAEPVPQPVTVLVTEEQIARAISRVLARSDARNGRHARVAG